MDWTRLDLVKTPRGTAGLQTNAALILDVRSKAEISYGITNFIQVGLRIVSDLLTLPFQASTSDLISIAAVHNSSLKSSIMSKDSADISQVEHGAPNVPDSEKPVPRNVDKAKAFLDSTGGDHTYTEEEERQVLRKIDRFLLPMVSFVSAVTCTQSS